jgi:GAF domain-containing protein
MADRERWLQILRADDIAADQRPQRIAEECVHLLGVTGAGISIVSDTGNRAVVCATDGVSARIEELQVTLGEGPCVDAVGRAGPVLVGDLLDNHDVSVERWPTFLRAAHEVGVRAVFAFPMRVGALGIGAVDLYRSTPGSLSEEELSGALIAAELAGVAVLGLRADADAGFVEDADNGAYLAQVHQATGMVMVQLGISVDEAFLLLRARAFAAGRPLRDVATDVVQRRLRFSEEDG